MRVESAVGCFPLILDRIKSNSKRYSKHPLIRTYIFFRSGKKVLLFGVVIDNLG